jgi:hypothetical protein
MAPFNAAAITGKPTIPTTNVQLTKQEPVKANLSNIERVFAWFQSDETSLISKISAVAIAIFALLTLGSLTGRLLLSFGVAAAVVGGSCIWAATKGVFATSPAEEEVEELHSKFIEALSGGDKKYEAFPVVNLTGPYETHSLSLGDCTYPLIKGQDSDGRPLVFLKLQDKTTQVESVTVFARQKSGYWHANVYGDERSPFQKGVIDMNNRKDVLWTMDQLVAGNHSKYNLAKPIVWG